MSDEVLRQAYNLIHAGQFEEARVLLSEVCRNEPENIDAWWLAAHALDDPNQIQFALSNVLRLNPQHPQAREMLKRTQVHQPPRTPQPNSSSGALMVFVAVSVVVSVIMAVTAFFFVLGSSQNDASEIVVLPTILPTEPPTLTPTMHPSATPLPPTWTPQPTLTNFPTLTPNPPTQTATPTASIVTLTDTATAVLPPTNAPPPTTYIRPTANPVQFGETYWYGDGLGLSMEDTRLPDGRLLRFYQFPVLMYVAGADDAEWSAALNHTVTQVNRVLPLVLTPDIGQADIIVHIMDAFEYERSSGCPAAISAGCASMMDRGIQNGVSDPRGEVWINRQMHGDKNVTLLHEVLHAMGVRVHSPFEPDVMYPVANFRNKAGLTERDINTLLLLYANPSYAD